MTVYALMLALVSHRNCYFYTEYVRSFEQVITHRILEIFQVKTSNNEQLPVSVATVQPPDASHAVSHSRLPLDRLLSEKMSDKISLRPNVWHFFSGRRQYKNCAICLEVHQVSDIIEYQMRFFKPILGCCVTRICIAYIQSCFTYRHKNAESLNKSLLFNSRWVYAVI